MLGVWTGALGHIGLATAGLSAIVAASAVAFATVKWIGVVYLFWLGIRAVRSTGGSFIADQVAATRGDWTVYRQGVLVNLFNPKVAIFFLAFLPQFVVAGAGQVWLQLAAHGFLIILIAGLIEPPLVLIGDRLTRKLRTGRRLALWLDRTLGGIMIGLGVKLAMAKR